MPNNIVPTNSKSPEILRIWAEEVEREIAEITSGILPLQQRLDAAREKLDLIRRLIHLSDPASIPLSTKTDALSSSTQPTSLPGIEDRIEEILGAKGKPMHIREIRDSLIQMGIPLPGRGDEANIILRLRRDRDRFIRTERGTYALVVWNLPEYSPAPRKKELSRKRRTSS